MAYSCNILLGRITKTYGFEGVVTVKLEKVFTENLPLMESVFLEIDGRPVPFLISDTDYSGADSVKLRFEGYNSVEKISEFTGCKVFLTSMKSDSTAADDTDSLTGYIVLSQDNRLLGSIKHVVPNQGQWLLSILSPANKKILVPLHEDLVVSIDHKKKIIVMNIPDGLTDIN